MRRSHAQNDDANTRSAKRAKPSKLAFGKKLVFSNRGSVPAALLAAHGAVPFEQLSR
jgi:hypothetical protein